MAEPQKRMKALYIGAPACFKLELACQHLTRAFGECCYIVGSVTERSDWRDVDIVMILDDDDFQRQFPDTNAQGQAWEFDPKWLLMSVAISDWLSSQTGLPVDFKFQPRTRANATHKGKRFAIGLSFEKCDPAAKSGGNGNG